MLYLFGQQRRRRREEDNESTSQTPRRERHRHFAVVAAVIRGAAARRQQLGRHGVQRWRRVRLRVDLPADDRRPAQSVRTQRVLLRSRECASTLRCRHSISVFSINENDNVLGLAVAHATTMLSRQT